MIDTSKVRPQTLIGKLARVPLKLFPPATVMPVLQGPLKGSRWITGSATHGCWLGGYEKDKQLAIARLLRKGDVFFDIGANVGFYTLLAAKLVGPGGSVLSIEPSPRNVVYLKEHLALNGTNNVTVIEAAVCEHEGFASFTSGDHPCVGHLSSDGETRVRTVSIDWQVQNERVPPPGYIKIDVEGAECEVLAGGAAVLERHRPVIFLATHGEKPEADSLALLRRLKYRWELLGPHEYICR